ncbi:MAG: hypothetical protein Q8K36_06145 [Alphaproteobacteria bacterium]|nr:hypothetical protein [Alphaproteobacteria bacterium]
MNKLNFSKKYFGIFLYFLALVSPLSGMIGEFGGVFVDTLNFSHQGLSRSGSTIDFRTGRTGNVHYIDGNNFDLDAIHAQLQQSTDDARKDVLGTGSDAPNAVMAGLTLVIQCGEKVEAFYQPLAEVFRSGSVERIYQNKKKTVIGPSEKYQPIELLQNFGERLQTDGSKIIGKDRVKICYQDWKNAQQKILQEALGQQETALRGALERTQALSLSQSGAVEVSVPSVYSVAKILDDIRDQATKVTNENFGSSIDSEQYLLAYLAEKLEAISPTETPKSKLLEKYGRLLTDYKADKLNQLKNKFKTVSSNDLDAVQTLIRAMGQEIEDLKNIQEVGLILHIHSVNEICCCCAYSIAHELVSGPLGTEVKNAMIGHNVDSKVDPFFLVSVSASKKLRSDVRQGIGDHNVLPEDDYERPDDGRYVKISNVMERGLFLQNIISGGGGR